MTDALTRQRFTGQSDVILDPEIENFPIDLARVPWLAGALDGSAIHVCQDGCSFSRSRIRGSLKPWCGFSGRTQTPAS